MADPRLSARAVECPSVLIVVDMNVTAFCMKLFGRRNVQARPLLSIAFSTGR